MRTNITRLLALLLALIALLPLSAAAEDAYTPELLTYIDACKAGDAGDYYNAIALLRPLGDYLDCPQRIAYYTLRWQEEWTEEPLQDWFRDLAKRYADLGNYLDCPQRAADLTAQADKVMADKLAALDEAIALGQYQDARDLLVNFGAYGRDLANQRRLLLQEVPLQADAFVSPNGSLQFFVETAACMTLVMQLDESALDSATAIEAAVRMPRTTFPLTLSADDSWILKLAHHSRSVSYLSLVLPNGNELIMSAKASHAKTVDALLGLNKQGGASLEITEGGDPYALTLTGADGARITVPISKVEEKTAGNPEARFLLKLNEDGSTGSITFNPDSTAPLTLEFTDFGQVDILGFH